MTGDGGLVVFFLIGLLGGAHCLGMCGPLVTLYADRMSDEPGRGNGHALRQHALFNLGRTASYAALGALVGALGGLVFDAASLAPVGDAVRAAVGVVVGLAIVAVGAGYLVRGTVTHSVSLPGFQRVYSFITRHVDARVDGPGIAALGAVHGLLPCPLLYPAFLYAFSQGSAVTGGLSLAVLGLGTFPTLFAYGTVVGSVSVSVRRPLHRALGAVFVVLGTIPLAKGLAVVGIHVPSIPLPMPPMG
ncbi:MAG: sulfite exporter TauE/SafE family protein [Haloferacaceae archaeon]